MRCNNTETTNCRNSAIESRAASVGCHLAHVGMLHLAAGKNSRGIFGVGPAPPHVMCLPTHSLRSPGAEARLHWQLLSATRRVPRGSGVGGGRVSEQ